MKEELKKTYREFVSWVKYVREFKDNKDNDLIYDNNMIAKQKEIEELKKTMDNRAEIAKSKDGLIELLDKRISLLGTELSSTKKRNSELRNTISMLYRQNQDLQSKVDEKELLRRKKAGAIGGLKATITKYENKIAKLEKELERANQKITWLKNNQKAPTKEEILAYEMRMKEVEKRQHEKRSK